MWFVDNIDEIFSEFQVRNIEIADTLKTHPYGLREFCFIDLNKITMCSENGNSFEHLNALLKVFEPIINSEDV